mmetsp:Transcript_54959/g.176259  ORF Transcript_54959/g.176259 Transcript_54959/m.176259 type:complete len:340 (+) Transcript_54959:546-1565(+)
MVIHVDRLAEAKSSAEGRAAQHGGVRHHAYALVDHVGLQHLAGLQRHHVGPYLRDGLAKAELYMHAPQPVQGVLRAPLGEARQHARCHVHEGDPLLREVREDFTGQFHTHSSRANYDDAIRLPQLLVGPAPGGPARCQGGLAGQRLDGRLVGGAAREDQVVEAQLKAGAVHLSNGHRRRRYAHHLAQDELAPAVGQHARELREVCWVCEAAQHARRVLEVVLEVHQGDADVAPAEQLPLHREAPEARPDDDNLLLVRPALEAVGEEAPEGPQQQEKQVKHGQHQPEGEDARLQRGDPHLAGSAGHQGPVLRMLITHGPAGALASEWQPGERPPAHPPGA